MTPQKLAPSVRIDPQTTSDEQRRRFQKKLEIERVLCPYPLARHEHLAFCVNLALTHNWTVKPVTDDPDGAPCAVRATRTIYVEPLSSDADVAVFCHEGGHLEDPRPGCERAPGKETIAAETFAWRFAINTLGRRWSQVMQDHMRNCLIAYMPNHVDIKSCADMQPLWLVDAAGAEAVRTRTVSRIR